MNFICISKEKAESLRKVLLSEMCLAADVKVQHFEDLVCFPITKKPENTILKKNNLDNVEYKSLEIQKKHKIKRYQDLLKNKLSQEQIELLPKSYDIVGTVAIVDIPDDLDKKLVADAILKASKHIKTVLNKVSERTTDFRLYELEYIWGDTNTETIHRESNFMYILDPKLVYFSPREASERERIADLVKKDERVLVMFAGVGPYAIHCAKRTENEVYAVELNPHAVGHMRDNIKLNKLENIVPIEADVSEFCPNHLNKFDRIVMPLPKNAEDFLELAYNSCKDNGVIHFYSWGVEPDIFSDPKKRIQKLDLGEYDIISEQKVLSYAPRVWKVRIDIQKRSKT